MLVLRRGHMMPAVYVGEKEGRKYVRYEDGREGPVAHIAPIMSDRNMMHTSVDEMMGDQGPGPVAISPVSPASVVEWAETTFPDSDTESVAAHMIEEVIELFGVDRVGKQMSKYLEKNNTHLCEISGEAHPIIAHHVPSVQFLLWHLAHKLNMAFDYDIAKKFAVVAGRTYGEADADGVRHYTGENEEAAKYVGFLDSRWRDLTDPTSPKTATSVGEVIGLADSRAEFLVELLNSKVEDEEIWNSDVFRLLNLTSDTTLSDTDWAFLVFTWGRIYQQRLPDPLHSGIHTALSELAKTLGGIEISVGGSGVADIADVPELVRDMLERMMSAKKSEAGSPPEATPEIPPSHNLPT